MATSVCAFFFLACFWSPDVCDAKVLNHEFDDNILSIVSNYRARHSSCAFLLPMLTRELSLSALIFFPAECCWDLCSHRHLKVCVVVSVFEKMRGQVLFN